MVTSQFLRNSPPRPEHRQTAEERTFAGTHTTILDSQLVGGDGDTQAQTFNPPNYLSQDVLSKPGGNTGIHHYAFVGSGYTTHIGSASLPPVLQTTHHHSRPPVIDPHGQENASGSRRPAHNVSPQVLQSVAGPSGGTSRATVFSEEEEVYVAGSWPRGYVQQHFANPMPNHTFQRNSNGSDAEGVYHAPAFSTGYVPTTSDRPHEQQHPVMHRRSAPVSHPQRCNDLGLNPLSTTEHPAFPPRGPPMEATTYHGQQRSNGAPALTGASGEKTDTLSRAERWDPHNPHNEGARGGEGVEEIPCHPTEVQPSRRRRKAKEVADPEDAMPTRKRRRGRKSGDPTNQVPVVSAVTRGSSQFKIPQSTYTSRRRQVGWVQQLPIEYGRVRLTDAADPKYLGTPDQNDIVLNYGGVGSSISCRLSFSGCQIGKVKILTANHKNVPEHITKRKLASKIAKLVESHIETIKAQTNCSDVTFDNVVLTRVHHVSKATWQPELWCEVAAPGCDSS